jgi:hypothetical protein
VLRVTNNLYSKSTCKPLLNLQETGARCSQVVASSIHDEALKAHIVEQHNKFRSVVALGQETRGAPGPQPSAANLRKMVVEDFMRLT